MPIWLLVAGRGNGTTQGDGLTYYYASCGYLSRSTTEAEMQHIARDSYTLAKLFIRVTANDLDGTTTVKTRVNGGDGNQSVSILTTQTGTFQDTVNSDALVNGNLFNYQIVTGGTSGGITFTILSGTLETASNTTPIIGSAGGAVSSGSITRYRYIMGGSSPSLAETPAQYTFRSAATLSNFRIYAKSTDVAASTVRIRKNGANGNQSVSVPQDTEGAYEDAVNSDSISAGDEVNLQLITGANTGPSQYFAFIITQVKSNSIGRQTACAGMGFPLLGWGKTRYFTLEGHVYYIATAEIDAQCLTRMAFLGKNFFVNVQTNTVNGSSTFRTRKNTGNGNLSVSVGAAATGFFEDTVNTDTLIATDVYNFQVVTGGTSGSMDINAVGFELQQAPALPELENKSANMGSKMVAAGLI